MLRWFLFLFGVFVAVALRAADERPAGVATRPRAELQLTGRLEWARLATIGPHRARHVGADPKLLAYLRAATSLAVEDVFRSVRATTLDELCRYPFITSENIVYLSRDETQNLGEYLRRGGFLFIDACRDRSVNSSISWFLKSQLKVLSDLFPDLRSEELRPEHQIFSIYFKMTQCPPSWNKKGQPLQALFSGDRMIAIISLNGFQCAWSGYSDEKGTNFCAQMMANIYIYAMIR